MRIRQDLLRPLAFRIAEDCGHLRYFEAPVATSLAKPISRVTRTMAFEACHC